MRSIKIKFLFILFSCLIFHIKALKAQCDCEVDANKIISSREDEEAKIVQKDKILNCLDANDSEGHKYVKEVFGKLYNGNNNILFFQDTIINKYCAKICRYDTTTVLKVLRKALTDSEIEKKKFKNFSAVRASLICIAVKSRKPNPPPKPIGSHSGKKDTTILKNDLMALEDKNSDLDRNNRILLSLLGLIIIGIIVFLIDSGIKKKKNNINSLSSNTDHTINSESQKINIDKHEEILANIKRAHKSEIEELQSKIEALQKPNIGGTEKKDSATAIISNYQASTSKPSKLYVSIPTGKAFYRSYETLIQQDTYFVIEYEFGSKEGKITLVDDSLTLAHAYSMVDSLRGVCELKGTGRPSTNIKVNVTPGRVEKTTDAWVLTQPIILEWKS
jgi:hypothetical protein